MRLGLVHKHDEQLYKVSRPVKNDSIADHLIESFKVFNNLDDVKKSDEHK